MIYEDELRKLAADGRVYDDQAYTLDEAVPFFTAMKKTAVWKRLTEAIEAGTWEQVYKRGPKGQIVKAYRPKK